MIPYGFFSGSYLDWSDSSLILQSNMDCIIDRTRVMDGSVSHKLVGGSGENELPPRPSRALDYVTVSFILKYISEFALNELILSCPMGWSLMLLRTLFWIQPFSKSRFLIAL